MKHYPLLSSPIYLLVIQPMIFGKILSLTHEGMMQVKTNKINILMHKLELFRMGKGESIGDMYSRFTNIISGLKALGKGIPTKEQVAKILRSLTVDYEKKVTAMKKPPTSPNLKLKILSETFKLIRSKCRKGSWRKMRAQRRKKIR